MRTNSERGIGGALGVFTKAKRAEAGVSVQELQ